MSDFDCFAQFYDLDCGDFRDDLAFYRNLAQRSAGPLLELGCGTGRLLLALAADGRLVTGVDLSSEMLAIASQKVEAAGLGARVRLVRADVRDFDLGQRFALASFALNGLMHINDLSGQERALRSISRHLEPGGLLAIDLFNPDLEELAATEGLLVHDYTRADPNSGLTVSKFSSHALDPSDQRLDFTLFYDAVETDGTLRRVSVTFSLHYFWPREIELLLDKAGYRLLNLYGSYDLDEYCASSPRLIVLAIPLQGG